MDLPSYFLGFSIWDADNICLPWSDTLSWFDRLGITPVRTIISDLFDNIDFRDLSQSFDYTTMEGYVVRNHEGFAYTDFDLNVAKFVRPHHVTTDKHWKHQAVRKNALRPKPVFNGN